MILDILFFLLGAYLGATYCPALKIEAEGAYTAVFLYYGKNTRKKLKLFNKFW